MKSLLLNSDEFQKLNNQIYEANIIEITFENSGDEKASDCTLMALQHYLKNPNNYCVATQSQLQPLNSHSQPQPQLQLHKHSPQSLLQPGSVDVSVSGAQTHQQLLLQSQNRLKDLQLKQPTVHQQHITYRHHHPYYQQGTAAATSVGSNNKFKNTTHHQQTNHTQNRSFPIHSLNQNSNISAASSSTGGGTASSYAPTQQSNATNSSISSTANARSTGHTDNTSKHAANGAQIRNGAHGSANNSKKIKTEPSLSQYHQTERMSFANTHIVWGEEHWRRVVFQDERRFNLDGPDGFSTYFHDLRNYEQTLSQRPRGNSVYIYILITAGGPIHMEVSTAKQKPQTYIETILRERPNIISKLGGNPDFILQDHNWAASMLPTTQEWLDTEGIKTQKWPTIAHDLNIMENIWGWMIREVYEGGRKFSRKDDLIFRIREAWTRMPMDFIMNLYSTLPERITELYYTRGIYTNC